MQVVVDGIGVFAVVAIFTVGAYHVAKWLSQKGQGGPK
jgi:hypothetical protein